MLNIISGGQTEEEAFNLYVESKRVFGEGGFNLRKFLTNSRRLQEWIDLRETLRNDSSLQPQLDEPTFSEDTLGVSESSIVGEHKVLGVTWNLESDQLIFDINNLAQLTLDLRPTKRNLVSLIGKFYDPLGFLSPVIIRFKVLLQKLCQCKTDWDKIIPEELKEEWKQLISGINVILSVSIPRSYFSGITSIATSFTLCGFCDASTRAYAAVIYLLLETEDHSVVKRCLHKMVGRANLSQDELLTAVTEIEAVINSRPLSYISSTDLEEPLTPSHLIVGRRLLNLPDYLGYVCDPGDEDFEVNDSQLKRRMKHLASVLSHFWRRWRTEYLNELRECHRYSTAKKAHLRPTVSLGDIVIIHDETLPRGFWKLGQIQEIHPGRDGLPRSALVRVATRDRQSTLLTRPLQLLYPLEIDTEKPEVPSEDVPVAQEDQTPIVPESNKRVVRAAAKKASQRTRAWIQELQSQD